MSNNNLYFHEKEYDPITNNLSGCNEDISELLGKIDELNEKYVENKSAMANAVKESPNEITKIINAFGFTKDKIATATNTILNMTPHLIAPALISPLFGLLGLAKPDKAFAATADAINNRDYGNSSDILFNHELNDIPLDEKEHEIQANNLLVDTDYRKLSVSDEYINVANMTEEERNNFFRIKQDEFDFQLSACTTERDKAVVAAKYLTTSMPKLPYFWGGGHESSASEMVGISPKLGSYQSIQYGLGEPNWPVGKNCTYSYDCSGFVSWCLINSEYSKMNGVKSIDTGNPDTGLEYLGENYSITDDSLIDKVKAGDLSKMSGHVGIIVGVDKEKKEITTAHSCEGGGGFNLTTQSTVTGLVTMDDIGNPNDINLGKHCNSKVGSEYFTDVVLLEYDDEKDE